MTPEQDHITGVLAAFRALGAAVYERDALPDVLPPAYSEIEVVRRPGGNRRAGGAVPTFGVYEIHERSTSPHAVKLRAHRDTVARIEGAAVTVNGITSTPVHLDGADPITPDDGWYVAFRTWVYALF